MEQLSKYERKNRDHIRLDGFVKAHNSQIFFFSPLMYQAEQIRIRIKEMCPSGIDFY